jgi:hypothetical protein
VDGDETWKRDIDFVIAKHSMDAVLAVAFAWPHDRQQHFRIFDGILSRMQPWLSARLSLANKYFWFESC